MKRLLTIALVALAVAAPAAAQDRAPLGDVLDSLRGLWAREDASAISDYIAASGADLEIGGASMGGLNGRKLSAALRRVFDDRETVSVVSRMTSPVQGVEDRAFGEFEWVLRVRGATVSENATVFVALVHEPAGWRITQIRILE